MIYLYSIDEKEKSDKVNNILSQENLCISTQVLNEFSNTLIKKFNQNPNDVIIAINELGKFIDIVSIDLQTVTKALQIKDKVKYSYYDSLIIASSLLNECSILLSEDMQHNQFIGDNLRIINPFKL